MPDAWVRPGEIPWAPSYSAPISPTDAMDAEGLVLSVTPVLDSLPLGAPVRVNVELSNDTDVDDDPLSIFALGDSANGSLVDNGDGADSASVTFYWGTGGL